jgi:hypothetical protein
VSHWSLATNLTKTHDRDIARKRPIEHDGPWAGTSELIHHRPTSGICLTFGLLPQGYYLIDIHSVPVLGTQLPFPSCEM